jgi:hypothetical protein
MLHFILEIGLAFTVFFLQLTSSRNSFFNRGDLNARLDLKLSLDRIERETQIDTLVQNFTEAILEARSLSVPLVRPNRYCLTFTPELMLRISRKNALRQIAQSTENAGQIGEFEIHNRLVRDMCVGLWWQIALIATGPQIFLELHEYRQEQVP